MPFVPPPRARSTVIDSSSGLEVIIPAKKNPWPFVVLGFCFVIWALFSLALGDLVFSRGLLPESIPELFLLTALGAWALGGIGFFCACLWLLLRRERVRLQRDSLLIQREALGYSRNRDFELTHVQDLRVAPVHLSLSGLLAFDYGARTFRFGSGLDEAEARSIAEALLARNPAIGRSRQD